MQNEDSVRQRAHEIWERQGRPEGRQEEHWAQARREIEAGSGPPPPAATELDPSPTVNAPDDAGTTPAQAAAAVAAVGAPRKAEDKPA